MVNVTFKTISQQSFNIEVDLEKTIGELKAQIEADKGEAEFPADSIKLIYNGKVYEDSAKFEELEYDVKKFVVVMVMKKKAPPAPEPAPAPQVETSAAPTQPTEAALSTTPAPVRADSITTATPAAAPTAPTAAPTEDAAITPDQQSTIDALMAMGYAKDQSLVALRAAFWNADRAVEYLISGIPDDLLTAAAAPLPGGGAPEESFESGGEEAEGDPLSYIASLPQFNEIRNLVRANPEMLASVIQQIVTDNPEVAELIQQNPQAFLQRLNEGPAPGQAPGAGAGAGMPPNSVMIHLTPDEITAVQRLKNMGFPEQLCIEAYLACDKNEEAAVNYILGRMEEDD